MSKYVFKDDLFRELIIDNFAGGGGASTGIELALGVPVDIAINHDEQAIRMHEANHPFTKHYQESVWDIDPVEVTGNRPVGLAWFSPDCTHFSKAKGGKPKKKEIRGLAWVVIKWAKAVKPRVIMLENVEEFKTWGPLDENGYPIKEQQGETFKEWWNRLESLGYEVETKELRACDYGAPTTRKRLFIVARCDGKPIVWPKPTHGNGKGLIPYKTASDIIDWSIPGISIFGRKKPLVENTLRRITRGIDKFVIKNNKPFIMQYKFNNQPEDIEEPLRTITSVGSQSLITPTIMRYFSDKRDFNGGANGKSKPANQPLNTITTTGAGSLIIPVISQLGHTGFKSDRNRDISNPLSTIVSKAEHLLINPSVIPIGYGEAKGQAPRVNDSKEPLGTLVGTIKHNIVIPHIIKHYSGNQVHGSDLNTPLHTVTATDHNGLCSAILSGYYGNGHNAANVNDPAPTITAVERHALVRVFFRKEENASLGNWPQIRLLLNKYADYNIAEDEILIFEIDGTEYVMVDITMRMLEPKELYMAQGFPSDYNFTLDGKMTKTEQVKKVGNSVSPQVSKALVLANMSEYNTPKLETLKSFMHYATHGNLRNFVQGKDSII